MGKAKAEGKEAPKEDEEKKDDEKVEDSEDSEPEVEEEEKDEPPPKVKLDTDEKKKNFRVGAIHDLTALTMSSSFPKFSIPEKGEGFDEIQYEWTKSAAKCQEFLKKWVLEKKATTRVEDLVPGQWFCRRFRDWQTALKLWHGKVAARTAAVAKRAANKVAKEAKKVAK